MFCVACPSIKKKIVSFMDQIEIFEIPHIDGANTVPDTRHNLSYTHSEETRAKESQIEHKLAHARAISWRLQLEAEYGLNSATCSRFILSLIHI